MTDDEIRDQIIELVPILAQDDATVAAKVIAIRDWLHVMLPVADTGYSLSDMGYDHNGPDLSRLLRACEERIGGYLCGGAAEIARRVYEIFGFDAVSLNVGINNTPNTHVTTLVVLENDEGEEFWSMQDCYYNFTLRDSQGELMGYRELIRHLVEGSLDQVVIDDPALPKTPIIYVDVAKVPRINRRYHLDSECVRYWENFEEFLVSWQFRLTSTSMFDFKRQLDARIGRADPLHAFAIPLGVNGSRGGEVWTIATAGRDELLQRTGATLDDLSKSISLPPQPLDPIL